MDTSMEMDELLKGLFGSGGTEEKKDASSPFDAIDPQMLLGIMDILGELGTEDDAARLLVSMKPCFSPERASKVDEAVRVMKLAKAAKAAIKMLDNRRAEE